MSSQPVSDAEDVGPTGRQPYSRNWRWDVGDKTPKRPPKPKKPKPPKA